MPKLLLNEVGTIGDRSWMAVMVSNEVKSRKAEVALAMPLSQMPKRKANEQTRRIGHQKASEITGRLELPRCMY